jgi:hypothetical protein
MTIEQFAELFHLRITRDECGGPIIEGKRGHLWFKGAQLCLMVIDGAPAKRSRWDALGGRLWLGDISPDANGRGVQDVRIDGIPLENAEAAIQMVQARRKRVLSTIALEASRRRMSKARQSLSGRRFPALETVGKGEPICELG